MRPIILLAAIAVAAGPAAPSFGQDWLGTHLQTVQDAHIRQHQQRMVSGPASEDTPAEERSSKHATAKKGPGCSAKALPPSERRRMEAEYASRMVEDGKASADAWSQEQGRRFRQKLTAEGIC